MDLLDRVNALECHEEVRDNLRMLISSGLERDWFFYELESFIYTEHDICDLHFVEEGTDLYEVVRDIQLDILDTYS